MGVIIGIAVGGAAVLATCAALVAFVVVRRMRLHSQMAVSAESHAASEVHSQRAAPNYSHGTRIVQCSRVADDYAPASRYHY